MKRLVNVLAVMVALGLSGCGDQARTPPDPEQVRHAQLERDSARGDAAATYALARNFMLGRGVAVDQDRAVLLMKAAAEAGHPPAMRRWGDLLYDGEGVERDILAAIDWYRRAAEAGNAIGMYSLAWCLRCVPDVSDPQAAWTWFERAWAADQVHAAWHLGLMANNGETGAVDRSLALSWFAQGAERGDPSAQTEYGLALLRGDGLPMDEVAAQRWLRLAAEQEYAPGQFWLGLSLQHGWGSAADPVAALPWFLAAAEQEHVSSMYELGRAYLLGTGTSVDAVEAVAWLHRAAAEQHRLAMTLLGFCHQQGRGVDQDYGQAMHWFRAALAAGESEAAWRLGWLYEFGHGTTADPMLAAKLYRIASEHGEHYGSYHLARSFTAGAGVPVDPQQARHYFEHASEGIDSGWPQLLLARLYRHAGEALDVTDADIRTLLTTAAESGLRDAQRELGESLLDGEGDEPADPQAAKPWLEQAVAHGDTWAAYRLGMAYRDDPVAAAAWLRMAADDGWWDAQAAYADCLRDGFGVDRDPVAAVRWYRLAVDDGHVPSLLGLAACAEQGLGMSADAVAARRWYISAAETGDVGAQMACAEFHLRDTPLRDPYAALRWYRAASEQGVITATETVFTLYRDGTTDLPANLVEARTWAETAWADGVEDAEQWLETLPRPEFIP